MSPQQEIASIKQRFVDGMLPIDELLLHVEPILREAMSGRERAANEVVNAIERAIFTLDEPRRTAVIAECLDSAIELLLPH